jgi:hypothetical protein
MVNTQVFTLPLRIAQAICAIIELGLTAYGKHSLPNISSYTNNSKVVHQWHGGFYSYSSPSQANFLLFCSIWTILALIYLILAPLRFPALAHKYAILGIDAVTMIFWFAGFIAFAVYIGDWGCSSRSGFCRVSEAAVVFAAFEWYV